MSFLQDFFQLFMQRQDMLWTSLWEHIQLSIISLLIAVIIAVPVGILLSRKGRAAEFVIGIAAVLQTIPSLALLGFMILFVGIGTTPAIIALTAYALLPILRNTYTGIKEVDPAIREAARAMGMNSYRSLIKVELPIALPTVMAGIRTSMVLIVGTATLAALIGAGGLGDLIMTGIQRSNNEYILLGAIPAALLALSFDGILRVTERLSKRNSYKPVIAVIGLSLALIFVPMLAMRGTIGPDLVVGGKMGAEPEIVGNMYKHLIEDRTDLTVRVQGNLGATDFVFNALRVGDIDMYPEFSGTIVGELLALEDFSYDPDEAYEQAKEGIYDEYQFRFLEPMAYNNTYAIAVPRAEADENNIQTISDLENVAEEWTFGFSFEFIDRQDGYAGFPDHYGFELADVRSLDVTAGIRAIESGEVQGIDVFSTDPQIVENDLVVLEDDLSLFPPYQGAPLIRAQTLDQYPELEDVLNLLAGEITEEEIQELNYRVDIEDENPSDVAMDYLVENGFIEES
ncbi:ABC transporter permease/substrate-binding protein [Alkalicoccobacillus porphyridii]|uniref:ABC transporter permease/substrate-binding protein n=1 Tax=Alkalicoccobacillus porphyridii TaxID=2597270 RepID=A0A554A059_9BACI|nr:ABC transporter permease/substrate-binding protein [Alkalicoccobacillus porphyridii]TSB47026.1 ABC transporter permease/substrate-binding protein [Alkalicoccobacillus porphyridii]